MFHKISGEVVHGEKLWRQLGFPTANISYRSDDIENAVFFLNIFIDWNIYSGMWSHMVKKWVFEANIFDFDMDIYGKNIEVILLKKIRDNKKFNSLDELVEQIQKDKITCKNISIPVLTFGSFDLIHEWHKHYLFEAKKYGTHLSTVVASDENIEKIKGIKTHYPLSERVLMIKNLKIADAIIPGSNENPMQWIEALKPQVICLWYDQRWPFVDKLESEICQLWLDTKIFRIGSHKPEIYKSSLLKKKNS